MTKKLVCGVGINDADYVVQPTINGKRVPCRIYTTWYSMLKRCYDQSFLERQPSYIGCSVNNEWHSFMTFRAWMQGQDFETKQLDKDLILPGNKKYSKDTCVFVSKSLNLFLVENTLARGLLPLGVKPKGVKYQSECRDPFLGKKVHLGTFPTPGEAHLAWKKYKHELALEYAKLETDPRIIHALQTRYL